MSSETFEKVHYRLFGHFTLYIIALLTMYSDYHVLVM